MKYLFLIFVFCFLVGCGDSLNEKASKNLNVLIVNDLKELNVDLLSVCEIASTGGFIVEKIYTLGVFEGTCFFSPLNEPLVEFDVSRTTYMNYKNLTLKSSGSGYDVYISDEVKSIPYSDFEKSLSHFLHSFIRAKKEDIAISNSWS